ncbi:unnamed protein product [Staurois parvus]|uniref:Uncharacterized protein n=1 Tax=Staurois parvus TaxID=386267 RepID=A0ABN9DZW2_9NEOB|nr:unnamed protein product [Staurois parvus]
MDGTAEHRWVAMLGGTAGHRWVALLGYRLAALLGTGGWHRWAHIIRALIISAGTQLIT